MIWRKAHSKALRRENVSETGFSVLEALVAMAILAAAMLPLLALQGQFVQSVASFERADARISARQNALAYLKEQNFSRAQSGVIHLDGVDMYWTATLVQAPRRTRLAATDIARFEVALYNVEAKLTYLEGNEDILNVRGLGWRPLWPISGGL